jgi:hypothetical protein
MPDNSEQQMVESPLSVIKNLRKRIKQLEDSLSDAECCGNCTYLTECSDKLLANECCEDWECDEKYKENRL